MSQDYRPEEKSVWLALRDIALIVPRIFRYLWEVAPGLLSIQCLLMFVTAVIPAAIVWMTKVIIDTVVSAAGDEMAWTAVFVPVAVIFALWILQALCDAISGFTNHIFSEKVWYSAYQRILDKAGALDVAFYETPRFYGNYMGKLTKIDRIILGHLNAGPGEMAAAIVKQQGLIYLMELRESEFKVGWVKNRETLNRRVGVARQFGHRDARIVRSWPTRRKWEPHARYVIQRWETSATAAAVRFSYDDYHAKRRYQGHETFGSHMTARELAARGDKFFELMAESYVFNK